MTDIHPSAMVSPRAELYSGVKVGPYSSIGADVTIGRETIIGPHVVIEGRTLIGERNRIYPFSCIGTPPQDIGYRGEDTRLVIGNDNIIREYVTIHRGTTKERWETVVGDHAYIMAYAHVAHDCVLGDHVILSNLATLAGHIIIGNHVNVGGQVAMHQFVRVGDHAFIGGKSGIDRDVPPFMITAGERARLYGINRKGLARAGFPQETIDGLNKAFRIIWRTKRPFKQGIGRVKDEIPMFPELMMLLDFLNGSTRGVLR